MAKERVKKKYTTGKGVLTGFLTLTKPSQQYGTYTANILLSKEEGEALTAELKTLRAEQFKLEGKKGTLKDLPCIPYTTFDEKTEENVPDAEGRYILKTNNKAYDKDGNLKFKPQFINAKKEFIKGNIAASEGTVARLSVMFEGYKAGANVGISAKLLGGQIIELVEYQGGAKLTLDDFDEEDGFDGLGDEFTEELTEDEATTASDEEEDF